MTGPALLVRTLETLGQAVVDMRGTDAADPRLVLEIALVRLARRDAGPPIQALAERLDRLEKQTAGRRGSRRASAAGRRRSQRCAPARRRRSARAKRERAAQAPERRPGAGAAPGARTGARSPAPRRPGTRRRVRPVEIDDVILAWSDLLGELPPATKAAAQEAQPLSIDDNVITFGVPPGLLANAKRALQEGSRHDPRRAVESGSVAGCCSGSSPTRASTPTRERRPAGGTVRAERRTTARRRRVDLTRSGRRRRQRRGGRFGERHRQAPRRHRGRRAPARLTTAPSRTHQEHPWPTRSK